jgi:hypothetical protein
MRVQVFQGTGFTKKHLRRRLFRVHRRVLAWGAEHPLNSIVKGDKDGPVETAAFRSLISSQAQDWPRSSLARDRRACRLNLANRKILSGRGRGMLMVARSVWVYW